MRDTKIETGSGKGNHNKEVWRKRRRKSRKSEKLWCSEICAKKLLNDEYPVRS